MEISWLNRVLWNESFLRSLIISAAAYFDNKGLDTPIGFPGIKYPNVPTPQEVSNALIKILEEDSGNKGMVSNLHMTYGQFLVHDMDLSPNAGGCKDPT